MQVAAGAADRAAGADAGHEVGHRAVGVAPDLGAGGLVVAERAVRVGVLVGLERARDLPGEPVGDAVVGVRVVGGDGGRGHDDLGAVGREHVALVLADLVRQHEDAAVAALLGDQGEADPGVAGGGLDDGAAGLQQPVALGRVDDAGRDAVFRGAARVQVLELDEDRRGDAVGHLVQPDQRGIADQVKDGVGVSFAEGARRRSRTRQIEKLLACLTGPGYVH